jgi:hypothetical protein
MEQSNIQESCLDVINHPLPDHISTVPTVTLWNSLEPSLQNQLTQRLAELIHRIRKAVAAIEKEESDEQ